MRDQDLHEDDWKEEAPLLASLDKSTPLDVPEGYFEGLPSRILDQIRNLPTEEAPLEETQPRQLNPAPDRRIIAFKSMRVWGIAAGIALLAVVGAIVLSRSGDSNEVLTAETIREETRIQLAALGPTDVAGEIDITQVSDEQLFAALGNEGQAAFDDADHAVHQDEAIEYLKDVDLDDVDFQDLDIDWNDLR